MRATSPLRLPLPVLLAVLGLSCGSSSGEEVATDVVAFQPYPGIGPGVVVVRGSGGLVDLSAGSPRTILSGVSAGGLHLPFVELRDSRLVQLIAPGAGYGSAGVRPVPSDVVRCFFDMVCQTADGAVVDAYSLDGPTLRELPAVRGASMCDGLFCLVDGRAVPRNGVKLDVPGRFVDMARTSWADVGGEVYRNGVAFLRDDGVVVSIGEGVDSFYVKELRGLPPIRKLHRGGVYEDALGHMWYVGMAPEGWAVDVLPSSVGRSVCPVNVGKKLPFKYVSCVGPTAVPALDGMQPQVSFGDDFIPVLYALDKEGTLRCWSAPGGPACVKGE